MKDEVWRKLDARGKKGSKASVETCADCGEPVPVGSWPFCASKVNPEGHRKGTYRWGAQSVLSKKWWRVGK